MEKELDNIDKSIIRILQENARTPVKDIAKEVFLSSPAVSARIERLEKRRDFNRLSCHCKSHALWLSH